MIDVQKLHNRKIAIIGLGYIGSNLFNYLNYYRSEYKFSIEGFRSNELEKLSKQSFDFIFNCCGTTGDFRTRSWDTIYSNLFISNFILENVKINHTYVILSSTRIYGFSNEPNIIYNEQSEINNKSNLDPDYIYDGTKLLHESFAWNVSNQKKIKINICRLSNLFGNFSIEDLNDSTFLKVLIRHKLNNLKLTIEQNRKNEKDYVYIQDAIEGIILSAINSTKSDVYNIAGGNSISIEQWVNFLDIEHSYIKQNTSPLYSKIAIDKAKNELKYNPIYSFNNIQINQLINGSN